MSNEVSDTVEKKEAVIEQVPEIKEKIDVPIQVDNVIKLDENYDDIFVTERNTFEISIEYYKENGSIIVEDVDDSFDKTRKSKKISITLKYPSQGDVTTIANNSIRSNVKSLENLTISDFALLEISRFLCLLRSWSLPQQISSQTIMGISPRIMRGILSKIRDKIGTEGII